MARNEIYLWILGNNGALAVPLWGASPFILRTDCWPNMRSVSDRANVITPQLLFWVVWLFLCLLSEQLTLKTLTKHTINESNHRKTGLLINPQGLQALKDAICKEQWLWAFDWSPIWDVGLCLHICTNMMLPFLCLLNLAPESIRCHFYIKVGPIKSSLQTNKKNQEERKRLEVIHLKRVCSFLP